MQQMDLVLRFIKKAAPNLSQDFKVYVPSKRLPLSEQKRMLSKQLHDFLHIYRKDTEQIRVESGVQLENERKKNRNKLIDDKGFQALLYKCTEADLEEIMSAYMKNSQDSSVFLGTGKNGASKNNESNTNNNGTQNFIEFKLTKNEAKTDELAITKVESETSLQEKSEDKDKKKNGEEDISSFDTHSEFSKSSDSEGRSRSRSRSSSPGSIKNGQSPKKNNKSFKDRKIIQKFKQKNFITTNIKNSSGKFFNFSPANSIKDKPRVNTKSSDYQTIISNIYLTNNNNNKSAKPRPKANSSKGLNRTNTLQNSSNNLSSTSKLAPLTINSQMSMVSNQTNFYSPMSTSSKDSLPISPLRLNSVLNQPKQQVNNTNSNFQKAGSLTNRSIASNSQNMNGLDDASVLSMGLKNLQLKQQERVYSAAKSFRVPTSLENEETVLHKPPSTMKHSKSATPGLLKSTNQNSDDDFEVKRLREITSMAKPFNNTGFESYFVDPSETATIESISSIKKNSLIEKLERQKEKTHKLLEKSKEKHNQMLLNHSSISMNRKNPTNNLNLYFSTVKN